MYVPAHVRRKGDTIIILSGLEQWALELGYKKCVLETGTIPPEAVALYKKSNYHVIPNYG